MSTIHTDPNPAVTAGARPPTWKVPVTLLVAMSIRVTRPLSLPAHNDPSPALSCLATTPTGI